MLRKVKRPGGASMTLKPQFRPTRNVPCRHAAERARTPTVRVGFRRFCRRLRMFLTGARRHGRRAPLGAAPSRESRTSVAFAGDTGIEPMGMLSMRAAGLALALAALATAALPGTAAAQGVVKSIYGDWQIRCDTPPGA